MIFVHGGNGYGYGASSETEQKKHFSCESGSLEGDVGLGFLGFPGMKTQISPELVWNIVTSSTVCVCELYVRAPGGQDGVAREEAFDGNLYGLCSSSFVALGSFHRTDVWTSWSNRRPLGNAGGKMTWLRPAAAQFFCSFLSLETSKVQLSTLNTPRDKVMSQNPHWSAALIGETR